MSSGFRRPKGGDEYTSAPSAVPAPDPRSDGIKGYKRYGEVKSFPFMELGPLLGVERGRDQE